MIVTTTLIFQFLFQFYSYLTVHFLLGNICTSNFGCHQTARNALIHLAWIIRWLIWCPYCNCEFSTFFLSVLQVYWSWFHFSFSWRKFPHISTPSLSKFISSLTWGKGWKGIMQNLSVLKVSNFLFKGVTFLFQHKKHKIASFNTRRKTLGKAALVGAERWVGSMDYTWAQESFRTHPETGSDETSSHMNWGYRVHPPHFLSRLAQGEKGKGKVEHGGREEEARGQTVGKVPTLPLSPVPLFFWVGIK